MKRLILLLFFLLQCTLYAQNSNKILNGTVTFQNSGSSPAIGVAVSGAFGTATPVYTDEFGAFHLIFPNKKEGDKVKIQIGSEDKNGTAIELVNDKELDLFKLPRNPEEGVRIVVCRKGKRNEAAQQYYNILVKTAEKTYTQQLNRIEGKLNQNNISNEERRALILQMDELRKERDEALNKAEELATYIASIDLDQASELVKQAIQKIEQEEDVEAAILILDNEQLDKAYKNAMEQKEKAEKEMQKVEKEIRQVVKGYGLKINLLESHYKFEEIEICYKKIINIKESNHDLFSKENLAFTYFFAANAYRSAGKYLSALNLGKKSMHILNLKSKSENLNLAAVYNSIAKTYQSLGKVYEALDFQQKTIAIQEQVLSSAHPKLAISYNNIATIYGDMGNCKKAVLFFRKAILIQEGLSSSGFSNLAISYNNISTCYIESKEYEKALKHLLKAINIQEMKPNFDSLELATLYANMGLIYQGLKQYDKSLRFQLNGLDIEEKILGFKHPDLAGTYSNIGLTYQYLGNYLQAIIFYQKGLKIALTKQLRLTITNNQGMVYTKQGKFKEAKELFTQFEQADTTNGRAYRNWAMYHALQNQKGVALSNLQKAVNLGYKDLTFILEDDSLESIREEIEFQRLVRELKIKLDREKK